MKKINLKTKIIAAVLSAVTVFSVTAATTTTAFAAETKISTGTTITNDLKVRLDRDANYAEKIVSNTLFKMLEATKYGKFLSPFLSGALDKTALTPGKAKIIADYAAAKGLSVRKLLENNGFDVSKLPKDANLLTAKAFDDSVTKLSKAIGYNYVKAYYKGVCIDKAGAGEANVQIIDCGYNSWKFSEWNYTKPGNACILF